MGSRSCLWRENVGDMHKARTKSERRSSKLDLITLVMSYELKENNIKFESKMKENELQQKNTDDIFKRSSWKPNEPDRRQELFSTLVG